MMTGFFFLLGGGGAGGRVVREREREGGGWYEAFIRFLEGGDPSLSPSRFTRPQMIEGFADRQQTH